MKLVIPENIPLRWELFRGFGIAELIKSALIMAVIIAGVTVFLLLSESSLKIIVAIIAIVFGGAICSGIFAQQKNNLSMYDYISLMFRFSRSQKRFISEPEEIVYAKIKN